MIQWNTQVFIYTFYEKLLNNTLYKSYLSVNHLNFEQKSQIGHFDHFGRQSALKNTNQTKSLIFNRSLKVLKHFEFIDLSANFNNQL